MAADQRHVRFQYSVLPPELRKNVLRYTTPADTYALSRTPGSVELVSNFYIDMERALFGAENDPPLDENERRMVQKRWRAYDYGCYLIEHAEENPPQPHFSNLTLRISFEIERRSALLGPGLQSVDLWIDYDPRKILVALKARARVPGIIAKRRFDFLMELCRTTNYDPYFDRQHSPPTAGTQEDLTDALDRLDFQRYVTDIASQTLLPGRLPPGDWTVSRLVRRLAQAAAQAGNVTLLLKFFDITAWKDDTDWKDLFDGLFTNVFFNSGQIIPQSRPEFSIDVKRAIRMLENEQQMHNASRTLLRERPLAGYFD